MRKALLKKIFFTSMFSLGLCISTGTVHAENIRTVQIGDMRVSLLSEGNAPGKPEVIINASPEEKGKYIPEGNFTSAVNAFLITTTDKKILVDTGYGRAILKNLEKLGCKPQDIDAILITHMHGDHIGGMLKDGAPAFPNAQIYIAEKELAYWQDKPAAQTLAAYGNKVNTFTPGEFDKGLNLFPGISAIATYGHTPGHTSYLVQSKNQAALIWGDITHVTQIQLPLPEIFVTYDVTPEQAVKTRQALFAYLADKNILVAATHIEKPGMGYIKSTEKVNSYKFSFIE